MAFYTTEMRRRTVLATACSATLGWLAGCSSGGSDMSLRITAVLTAQPVSDADIAEKVIGSPPPDTDFLDDLLADGSATVLDSLPAMDGDENRFVYDGTVYSISSTVESVVGTRYLLTVERASDSPVEYRFDDLPAVDRERLEPLIDSSTLGVSRPATYSAAERAESVLASRVGETVVIATDRRHLGVTLSEPKDVEQYRVTVSNTEPAAPVGRRIRSEYGFELSGLSPETEEIFETAVNEGTYRIDASEEPSAAFRSLVDRLTAHRAVRSRRSETIDRWYVVQFAGEHYWVQIVLDRAKFDVPDRSATATG
jgi:hypothetical protein